MKLCRSIAENPQGWRSPERRSFVCCRLPGECWRNRLWQIGFPAFRGPHAMALRSEPMIGERDNTVSRGRPGEGRRRVRSAGSVGRSGGIMTGAAVPAGANAVVMVEYTERSSKELNHKDTKKHEGGIRGSGAMADDDHVLRYRRP